MARYKRSIHLNADFSPGYAADWAFFVLPAFRSALDIIWTSRIRTEYKHEIVKGEHIAKKVKRRHWMWTQGRAFSFKRGDMIHTAAWDPKTGQCICTKPTLYVVAAEPTRHNRGKNWIEGYVDFDVYGSNLEDNRISFEQSWSCTQTEFVALLRTGTIRGRNLIPRTNAAA